MKNIFLIFICSLLLGCYEQPIINKKFIIKEGSLRRSERLNFCYDRCDARYWHELNRKTCYERCEKKKKRKNL